MWKEATVAKFKVLSQHLPWGTEESYDNLSQDLRSGPNLITDHSAATDNHSRSNVGILVSWSGKFSTCTSTFRLVLCSCVFTLELSGLQGPLPCVSVFSISLTVHPNRSWPLLGHRLCDTHSVLRQKNNIRPVSSWAKRCDTPKNCAGIVRISVWARSKPLCTFVFVVVLL
jgi:hypothetical protein